jgi:hypothetical protein
LPNFGHVDCIEPESPRQRTDPKNVHEQIDPALEAGSR